MAVQTISINAMILSVFVAVALAQDPAMDFGNMPGMEGMDMMNMGAGGAGGMDMMGMGGGGGMGGGMGGGGKPDPGPSYDVNVVKADVKFIKCAVCQEAVKQLTRQAAALKTKVSETVLTDIAEGICDEKLPEGAWLKETRLKATDGTLKLVADWDKATCGQDCITIQRACAETYGDYSLDAAEALYGGDKRGSISQSICFDSSGACKAKPKQLPKKHHKYQSQKKMQKANKKKQAQNNKQKSEL
eukprot:m.231211 g.231211  ORF g.231211 m.231211 type:complete len:245 (-) comp33599_c1_seq5:127-861(-)